MKKENATISLSDKYVEKLRKKLNINNPIEKH